MKSAIFLLCIICLSCAVYADAYGTPTQWGENVTGVKGRIDTEEKIIALTFDACGGRTDGYDKRLIDFLIEHNIPATLFINTRWIKKFPALFDELAKNKLFDIQNHGTRHKPCSVNGRSIYGISGTKSPEDVRQEVSVNATIIEQRTGKPTDQFRSGTAYYDEIAVKIIKEELDHEVIGFSIIGDAGGTFSKEQVYRALMRAKPGDIVILHMNRPEKEAALGVIKAIPELLKKGFRFVKVCDYTDKLVSN